MIHWEAPGPYVVAFSTRAGGVSEGPYESLNLGILTQDDPTNVFQNRRRLADRTGIDPERARMAWQRHGPVVKKASPEGILERVRHEPCDGWWSDEPGQGMLLLTADCLPVAIARANGKPPALAVLHVGWRGLLAGIVENGVAALGEGPLAAAVGPGIGPCCYEVGPEVTVPSRSASARTSSRSESSISGGPPSWPSTRQGSPRSSAPTSAPSAIPSSSSPTAGTAGSPGDRE